MLPNVLEAIRVLFQTRTIAGTRVERSLPKDPVFPFLTFQREPGIPHASNDSEGARITMYAWGRTNGEAYHLAMQVRAVLLPESYGAQSFYGRVGDVYFSGVEGFSGPSWIPEPSTGQPRYMMTWIQHYSRAA